ncbi:MAG: DUF3108 domain-containing protein [Bdellovibrionales bacterium]|nr:DUF3108 domain-containing protein [Bdellovibrionales bacterium]
MNRASLTPWLALSMLAFSGCSGKPLVPKIADADPQALPADLRTKFEVIEVGQPTPSPTPSPTPEPKGKGRHKKKKAPPVAKHSKKAPFVVPNRRPKSDPFWVGEKQTLEVTYLGLAAGNFSMEVLPSKKIAERNVYHFKGIVKSSALLDVFYRLDDMIESFWDYEGLYSHRFHMVLDETKQARDVLELYDPEKKKAFYWNRRNQPDKAPVETKEYFDMVPFAQDSFTAVYYLRTLPLEVGKTYVYPVVSEGKGWDCVVNVVRKEMMDTPLGKKMTIVVHPQTRYNGVMKQEKGEGTIWVTDDDRRFIVRLEAKVKIGAVAAQLKEIELGEKPADEPAPSASPAP